MRALASKEDIKLLTFLINNQNQLIKSLDLKVLKSEEKVTENNSTIKHLEDKVRSLKDEQKFLSEQDYL